MDGLDTRRAADQLALIRGRDPTREGVAVGADELDAVASAKAALAAHDSDRQQARARRDDRAPGTRVDVDPSGDALPVAQPELERRRGACGREARAAVAAGEGLGDDARARAV